MYLYDLLNHRIQILVISFKVHSFTSVENTFEIVFILQGFQGPFLVNVLTSTGHEVDNLYQGLAYTTRLTIMVQSTGISGHYLLYLNFCSCDHFSLPHLQVCHGQNRRNYTRSCCSVIFCSVMLQLFPLFVLFFSCSNLRTSTCCSLFAPCQIS